MFHCAMGENRRGFAQLGVGLAQAATLRRLVGERVISGSFASERSFLQVEESSLSCPNHAGG